MSCREGLTIITCTGGRPETFSLCVEYVIRQTWKGPTQWIVVNDLSSPSGVIPEHRQIGNVLMTWIYPHPQWQPGQNTLARNLLAAIPEVLYDKVLFFEDDDFYPSNYCENMIGALNVSQITGDPVSIYYHVPTARYRYMKNNGYASLCQTGIAASLLPDLVRACSGESPNIDVNLWRSQPRNRIQLLTFSGVVGMKGLPGRPGIGIGHRPDMRREHWTDDPNMAWLRVRIGDDAKPYEDICQKTIQTSQVR